MALTTQPSKRKLWCAFKGFGQWDCDDAPCENAGAFAVRPVGSEVTVYVCVRHLGYAIAEDCRLAEEHDPRWPATMVSVERAL